MTDVDVYVTSMNSFQPLRCHILNNAIKPEQIFLKIKYLRGLVKRYQYE